MPFIGVQPATVPLTSSDITDGIISTAKIADTAISTAKIADDAVGNTKLDLTANYAFTGTISGASLSGEDAFCANGGSSSWASDAAGGIVAFTDDSSNDNFDTGNRFDTSTSKYTARADGVYLFWYAIYTAQNDSDNGFGFLKNSTAVHMDYLSAGYFTYHGNDVTDHIMNGTLIIPLTASDTMAVTCRLQSDYYRGYSMFGGCRLA